MNDRSATRSPRVEEAENLAVGLNTPDAQTTILRTAVDIPVGFFLGAKRLRRL
jgi:hypothetical protein